MDDDKQKAIEQKTKEIMTPYRVLGRKETAAVVGALCGGTLTAIGTAGAIFLDNPRTKLACLATTVAAVVLTGLSVKSYGDTSHKIAEETDMKAIKESVSQSETEISHLQAQGANLTKEQVSILMQDRVQNGTDLWLERVRAKQEKKKAENNAYNDGAATGIIMSLR